MSTFQERLDKTREIVLDDNVGVREGLTHLYYWMRFEMAIMKRDRCQRSAIKYSQKLNTNLDVFKLRKELSEL